MTHYLRAYRKHDGDDPGKPGDPIRFVASTSGVKRDGLDLDQGRWSLENFNRNPVFLWVHNYGLPPIGRVEPTMDGDQLLADVLFDQSDDFARQVEQKYRDGFMNAVSVGWNDTNEGGVLRYDLFDVSAVPVPADPDALMERQARGFDSLYDLMGKVLGRSHSGEIDADNSKRVAIAGGAGTVATTTETHDAAIPNISQLGTRWQTDLDWEGASEFMIELYQPIQVRDNDERLKEYNWLCKHYRKLGKQAPEFRTSESLQDLSIKEIRGLFFEGEAGGAAIHPNDMASQLRALYDKLDALEARVVTQTELPAAVNVNNLEETEDGTEIADLMNALP